MKAFIKRIKIFKPIFYLDIIGFVLIKVGLNRLYVIANQRVSFG